MLTEKEKLGCKQILAKLNLQDLVTLTDTVTNRVVSPENSKEAVDAILLYSQTATQLLRRRKVKREHLYQYLAENGVIAPVTADKPTLIRNVLNLWGSSHEDFPSDDSQEETSDTSNSSSSEISRHNSENSYTLCSSSVNKVDGQQLAESFVPWFYKILNSLSTMSTSSQDWGPQHFWANAKCTILMLSNEQSHSEGEGSIAVSEKLQELVCKEKLVFNANVHGAKGQIDAYGLVRITVGGTVHRFSDCIGIFEQSFGLIQDPQMQNNWKIKFTDLKLKAQQQAQVEDQRKMAITGVSHTSPPNTK